MIDGVVIKPLKVFRDERGKVMRMMRCDDDIFKQFGEVYFSFVNPGVVKGWKKHTKMTQHFAVPKGAIKLVIYDGRTGSATFDQVQEIATSEEDYKLVRIPPQVWYAFRCESSDPAMIANCADIPHEPGESIQIPLEDKSIPYQWK